MLIFLLMITSSVFASEPCSYLYNNVEYNRTTILTIKGRPTNLAVNPNNDDLYFTLIDLESLNNNGEQTKMEQYVLRNGTPIKIKNINGQAAAVDVKKNRIYLASNNGISILNDTDQPHFFGLKDEDIVMLHKPQHDDKLYAVINPDNEVYSIDLKSKEKNKVENVPCAYILAVDANNNIYYECNCKYVNVLYKSYQEPVKFLGLGKDTARAITVDRQNRVILATNDGLYHLLPVSNIPRKMMNLDFIPSGIAFKGRDLYLATIGVIYKYSPDDC